MRSWLKWAGGAAALMAASTALAADHLDAPAVQMESAADINDVYAWVNADNKLVLVMTVFPAASDMSAFSDAVQYVFNVDTGAEFQETVESKKIVCTFAADKTASCTLGTPGQPAEEWVMGDAGAQTGLTSESGLFKVFAGLRADPFFFNLDGFRDAVGAVIAAAPGLTFDAANCPNVDQQTSNALVGLLTSTNGGMDPAVDFFADLSTLAIVVEMDPSLLNPQHNLVSIWASTHRAQ
jgi:hypothetical protein